MNLLSNHSTCANRPHISQAGKLLPISWLLCVGLMLLNVALPQIAQAQVPNLRTNHGAGISKRLQVAGRPDGDSRVGLPLRRIGGSTRDH